MATTAPSIVMLESGDRLTRAEFHRRYSARPDIKKAELIGGVVYVASPVRFSVHGEQHGIAVTWLGTYAALRPGVRLGVDTTVIIDADNEVQPDAFLFRDPPSERGARITDDGYVQGAPDLVIEIAASSASYDLHDKLEVYRRAGVREYIVWRVLDGAITWLSLRNGMYVAREPDASDVIESEVFPGLRLSVGAMLAGDRAAVLAALDPPNRDET